MQWLRLHTHPKLLAHQCGANVEHKKGYEPLHMQWIGIWNHWQPVTMALVVPDFDSRLKAWVTAGLQTIPLCSGWGSIPIQNCLHINVEHISGVQTNSYAVDGHMEPSATRYHGPCCPRFWQSAESLGHCWATNHTTMQWLRRSIPIQNCLHINVEHIKNVWTTLYAVDGHMEPLATRYHGPCCPRF